MNRGFIFEIGVANASSVITKRRERPSALPMNSMPWCSADQRATPVKKERWDCIIVPPRPDAAGKGRVDPAQT